MSKFEVGDLVKGLPESNIYGITNENMTKAVVRKAYKESIEIRVIEHKNGNTGVYTVESKYFEKIGHLEPFDREKFLELLKESKAKAAEYLSDADLSGADLSGANLSGADLRRADLSGANLRRADLSGANLRRADLRRADLSDANLSGADLSGADLSGADLSDANLRSADLRRANLSDANLSGADLSGADLRSADLSQTKGILDAINYLEAHFEKTEEGYIVYKTFGENYSAPDSWKIEPGSIIKETVNPDRGTECGCGINVAPIGWVRRNSNGNPYKLLVRWQWLPGVVVPFSTDGKIRCSKAEIIGEVE